MTQEQLVASEKMASLGALVAGVAHEINTPVGIGLTGITHFLSLSEHVQELYDKDELTEEAFKGYLQKSHDLANLINTNLERTAHLVSSFKQISVDQTTEEKRVFHLKKYLEETLLSISNITKKTNLHIAIECPDDLEIYSYPGAFAQIITNFIINSIKHGYKDKEAGTICIKTSLHENTFTLRYTDDGKGISQHHIDKIFDPFFTTNREHGGTGLGLNVIYNIVTSTLLGTIRCSSEPGHGVEFLITFDIKKD